MTINKPLLKLGDVVINIKSVELNGVNKMVQYPQEDLEEILVVKSIKQKIIN